MSVVRIGTRGSRLALVQAGWTADRLREAGFEVDVVRIRTTGDVIRDVPLRPEHGTSFFTKQIEDALLENRIDVAVHSCKDLATRLPDGLMLAAFPEREDTRDVLVSRGGRLSELPAGATVGTSSTRRKGFVEHARPDLAVVPVRGNVPTRVGTVDDGRNDAVVLAAAGLKRLGLADRITEVLSPATMVPAAGQGALALQIRTNDERVERAIRALDHRPTRVAVEAERSCLRSLVAGCQSPVGALAVVDAGELTLDAAIVSPDGIVRATVSADATGGSEVAEAVGAQAAARLLAELGVSSLRDVAWAGPPPVRDDTEGADSEQGRPR